MVSRPWKNRILGHRMRPSKIAFIGSPAGYTFKDIYSCVRLNVYRNSHGGWPKFTGLGQFRRRALSKMIFKNRSPSL